MWIGPGARRAHPGRGPGLDGELRARPGEVTLWSVLSGVFVNVRWAVPLLALALAGCPPAAEPPPPPPPAPPPVVPLPFQWPPVKGSQFPDLELRDATGETVRLSRFRGRTLLVEPVGMNCPACQAFTGGNERGGFGGVEPQDGVPGIDLLLERSGIDPRHPDLVIVQLLLFDLAMGTPTPADAAAWTAHFGLAERKNVVVLVGDDRLRQAKGTYELVPGFFLVDQGGMLLLDATGHQPKDDLAFAVLPTALELLGGPSAPAVAPTPAPPPKPTRSTPTPRSATPPLDTDGEDAPWVEGLPDRSRIAGREFFVAKDRCEAHLSEGRFAELEAELEQTAGRIEQHFVLKIEGLTDRLSRTSAPDRKAQLDAWVAGAPRSRWARGVRAKFHASWAWDARGTGYADTVTDEGWRLLEERLDQARADADAQLKVNRDCLPAHEARMTVALGSARSLPEGTADRWFLELTRVKGPVFLTGLCSRLSYLMPKWYGDEETMWAFVREQLAAHPDEPALQLLVHQAHEEMARASPDWQRYLGDHAAELVPAMDQVIARYPRSVEAWRTKRRILLMAKDVAGQRAAELGAAEAGDTSMSVYVCPRLLEGTDGFPRDPAKALSLLATAAYWRSPEAEGRLGLWICEGRAGLKADLGAGLAWLTRAAGHGDGDSMVAAASLLLRSGEQSDVAKARRWIERAAASDDQRIAGLARRLMEELPRAAPARPRTSADGYEDWYPDDVSPPRGTQYPCALEPLPRDLSCLPADERGFVNHAFALVLEATRARLVCLRDSALEGTPEARHAKAVASVQERLGKERVPNGLRPFVDDVRAALDLQVRFYAAFAPAARAERARKGTLDRTDWEALHGRFPEGRQASTRLMEAWMKLQARWGKRMTPALSDSLMHHLCALDIF